MNVLVYSGMGVSSNYLVASLNFLNRHLHQNYAIRSLSSSELLTEPWFENCSLLVVPGGRDVPYCTVLDGVGVKRIQRFVCLGGSYLGICAGSYFASSHCRFDLGGSLEVVGDRELKLFEGVTQGPLVANFAYEGEGGAQLVDLKFQFGSEEEPIWTKMYLNGGGSFILEEGRNGCTILAKYQGNDIEANLRNAVVVSTFGQGKVVLSMVHFEYMDQNIVAKETNPFLKGLVPYREVNEQICRRLFSLLNLKLNQVEAEGLELKNYPIIVFDRLDSKKLIHHLQSQLEPMQTSLNDTNDTFVFAPGHPTFGSIPILASTPNDRDQFPFQTYVQHLPTNCSLGLPLLFSQMVSSTQTILEKNYKLQSQLPSGSILLAKQQFLGKGRGNNSWVSNLGCLQFSLLIKLHWDANDPTPIAMLQYLFGLSLIQAVLEMEGCAQLTSNLKLKWPNDIYILTEPLKENWKFTDSETKLKLKKVGGILVNSSFSNHKLDIVIGCGLNVSNSNPTCCLNDLIYNFNLNHKGKQGYRPIPPLATEIVLAKILSKFHTNLSTFLNPPPNQPNFEPFLNQYYKFWLHSNQIVQLSELANLKVKVVGITTDVGELECISLNQLTDQVDPFNYQVYKLIPNRNSFDMWNNLILKK